MKILSILLTLSTAFLLTSCLDFEKQTLTYSFDHKNDTLKIFQYYEGITAGGDENKQMEKQEVEQLESVMNTERTFFFDNWISEYHKSEFLEAIAKQKKKIADPEKREKDPQKHKLDTWGVKFVELLTQSVTVKNGDFFLKDEKKVCICQEVTVVNVKKLLKLTNRLISLLIKVECAKNPVTELALARNASEGFECISLDGNRINLNFPITPAELKRVRKGWLGKENETMVGLLLANDIWVSHTDNLLKLTIGKPADKTVEVSGISCQRDNDIFLDYLKTKGLLKQPVENMKETFFTK